LVARFKRAWATKRWFRGVVITSGTIGIVAFGFLTYLWISYARIIDGKLAGEVRPVPRIFGRPFEVIAGQALTPAQLVQRLNDVGYAERTAAAQPGEFTVTPAAVVVVTRAERKTPSQTVRVEFARPGVARVQRLATGDGRDAKPVARLTLEAPLLAALAPGERRRHVTLSSLPSHVVNAVLAIEDRRFWDHPGVDPIGVIRAIVTNLRGDQPYLVGVSTIPQQVE
jgi:penicillin-binding protein 1B